MFLTQTFSKLNLKDLINILKIKLYKITNIFIKLSVDFIKE